MEAPVDRKHKWGEPDKDGVKTCARAYCGLRVGSDGVWQRKKGAHWRRPSREAMPPCFFAHHDVEAKSAQEYPKPEDAK